MEGSSNKNPPRSSGWGEVLFFVRAGFISSPMGFGVSYNLLRMYLSGLGVKINTVVKSHNPEPGGYTLFVAK